MPDIIIQPSKDEMDQLRRILIRYRDGDTDEHEIEKLITNMMAETFSLAKTLVRFTGA